MGLSAIFALTTGLLQLLASCRAIVFLIGERSEPLSRVFNDKLRDIYVYGGVRTYVRF